MTYLIKLSLAAIIGALAAGANWLYMSSQTRPTNFVGVASDLKAGQEIAENDLTPVPVPGDASELRKSLVPYANRSILLGRRATREYLEGDVILSRDLMSDADSLAWEVIGPFELISVGERFRQSGDRESTGESTRGNTVTIAVDASFDTQTSNLLSVIAGQAKDSREKVSEILAVQVVPSRGGASGLRLPGLPANSSQVDRVYQTVSLEGIANVPAVLLEGEFIRFVVPKSSY